MTDWRLKDRWDIYYNGEYGLKHVLRAWLTAWSELLPACGMFADALVNFLTSVLRVILIFCLPFCFWAAPLVAIFTARRTVPEETILQQMMADRNKLVNQGKGA